MIYNTKITISSLVVVIVLICSLFLLKKETSLSYTNDKEGIEAIKRVDKLAKESNSGQFIGSLVLSDINESSGSLKEIITHDDITIILRISDAQCNKCIEHSLYYLNKYKDQLKTKNIILIGNFRDRRSYSIFTRLTSLLPQNTFSLTSEDFILPVDSLNLPYIITTNTSLRIENIFVPLKEVPLRTNDFFEKTIQLL